MRAHFNRAALATEQQKYDQAIADYSKIIEIGPPIPEAYAYRGLMYKYLGKFAQALDDYAKAIEINPNYAIAYYYRGYYYEEHNDRVKAYTDLKHALELGLNGDYLQDAQTKIKPLEQYIQSLTPQPTP